PQYAGRTADADFGHQALKAFPVCCRSARLAKVSVNHDNSIFGPTQSDGTLAQTVLPLGAFGVLEHLTQRGLADIEISIALEVIGLDFRVRVVGHAVAS